MKNSDEFGGYKLPIADVIDGELRAVPRAIFAAAGALRGARGGVDIPDSDRDSIIRNLERYYDKMGMDSPFTQKNSFRLDDVDAYSERELESMFKHGVSLSQKNAKMMVKALKDVSQRDVELKAQRDAVSKANVEALKSLLKSL